MRYFCTSLMINIFMLSTAVAQDLDPGMPGVDMDTPSVEMDMPGQDGMSQNRDRLLLEKGLNDIKQALGELSAMSAWEAPGSLSDKERKEWKEQSRRLEGHIAVLEDLSSRLREIVEKDDAGEADYEKVKSEARDIINGLHNDVTTRNVDGDMAIERQRAVAGSLDSVSIL